MEEKRIMVEKIEEFWHKEEATFDKFMNIFYDYIEEHPKEFNDYDCGIKTDLDIYLNKGLGKRKLDKLTQNLYKKLVELIGEATVVTVNHEDGLYSITYIWEYPTHNYSVECFYVYKGYEEDYYDIDFEDDYDEEEYEIQEMENHKISCGLYVYEN